MPGESGRVPDQVVRREQLERATGPEDVLAHRRGQATTDAVQRAGCFDVLGAGGPSGDVRDRCDEGPGAPSRLAELGHLAQRELGEAGRRRRALDPGRPTRPWPVHWAAVPTVIDEEAGQQRRDRPASDVRHLDPPTPDTAAASGGRSRPLARTVRRASSCVKAQDPWKSPGRSRVPGSFPFGGQRRG